MIFTKTHIELESDDRWLLPSEIGQAVGYDTLHELCWLVRQQYEAAAAAEWKTLEEARTDGTKLENALREPSAASAETTLLAGKLIALESVLLNYVDDGYRTT